VPHGACFAAVVSIVAAPKDGQLTQPTNPHAHIVHGLNLTGVARHIGCHPIPRVSATGRATSWPRQ
jgi:hypothetical protein